MRQPPWADKGEGSCAGEVAKGCGCLLLITLVCGTCLSGCVTLLH